MFDFKYFLTNLLSFDIPFLLYYYINFRSLIICCLLSGDIYLSLGIQLSSPIFSSAPFTNCISIINNIQIGDANDIDVEGPMYNLIKDFQK